MYGAHVKEKGCPAGECTNLTHYGITDKCVGCMVCAVKCPMKAINGERRQKDKIDVKMRDLYKIVQV